MTGFQRDLKGGTAFETKDFFLFVHSNRVLWETRQKKQKENSTHYYYRSTVLSFLFN